MKHFVSLRGTGDDLFNSERTSMLLLFHLPVWEFKSTCRPLGTYGPYLFIALLPAISLQAMYYVYF